MQQKLIKKRDLEHESFRDKLKPNMEVRAQWQDLKWYTAVIDECCKDGKFIVTFTEYDDQYTVSIGQIQLKRKKRRSNSRDKDRSSHSDHHHHHRSHSRRHRDRHMNEMIVGDIVNVNEVYHEVGVYQIVILDHQMILFTK